MQKIRQKKAVVLFSGGLDSMLATKLLINQGFDVLALFFATPFWNGKKKDSIKKAAKSLGARFKFIDITREYLNVVRKPKHGYGKAMNPCIDCKIFMLKKAKAIAKKEKADIIATGEVLGERPMSQTKASLVLIEKEAGLKNQLLRPLSAQLLPETAAERLGLVNRDNLLSISGRSRKPQIALAKKFGIKDYPTPAGGCLLTQKEFAVKLRDLLKHKKRISRVELDLLKLGRHFRFRKNKIIVGRNKEENALLLALAKKGFLIFEVLGTGSPITLLSGPKTKNAIKIAASLTARYSDAPGPLITVSYARRRPTHKSATIIVPKSTKGFEELRVHA